MNRTADQIRDRDQRGQPERIDALDLLRGIAILGTFAVNVWIFTHPQGIGGFLADTGPLDTLAGAAERGWLALTNGKFLALLTLMFGIGLELQYRSARRRRATWPGWYLWRAGLLFIEGVLHYLLVFEADVLMGYAITSMLVAYLIGRSERCVRRWIVATGSVYGTLLVLLTVGTLIQPGEPGSPIQGLDPRLYSHGSYLDQVSTRVQEAGLFRVELVFIVPSGIVMFLLGARLLRAGVFETSARGQTLRRNLLILGLGIGLPLNIATSLAGSDWFILDRYLLPPFVALGLLALVTSLVLRMRREPGRVQHGVRSAGRMALSCYVLQNVLAGALCYGWGLGLATRLADYRPWWVFAAWAIISTAMVAFSVWWLRRFDRGPVELAWHWAYQAPQRGCVRTRT